jgi:F-type H+-transporting ATPase subunit b
MKRFTIGPGAVLAALLALAAPAALRAQDQHGGGVAQGVAATEARAEHKSVLTPEWTNVSTTVIVFGLLLVVLRVFAWKPILEGLHKREQNIRGALEAAQQAKAQAERVQQEFRQKMAENDAKIAQEFEKARERALQLADEFLAQARAETAEERQRLLREIETAKDQALQEIWKQTVELASLMSSKAIRRSLSPEDHRRLIDESLAELRQRQEAMAAGGRL